MNQETKRTAIELIQSIRNELAFGTQHFNQDGDLLETELDILECLAIEGKVTLLPTPERRHLYKKPV